MWISELPHYGIVLLDEMLLLFLTLYFIVTLSDLECDFLNPPTCCNRMNKWVIPELVGVCFITIVNLLNLHLVMFILSSPVSIWLVYRLLSKPPGRLGLFDPLEIHNRQQLRSHMREAMGKVGYHLVMIIIYIYLVVCYLLIDDTTSENSNLPVS